MRCFICISVDARELNSIEFCMSQFHYFCYKYKHFSCHAKPIFLMNWVSWWIWDWFKKNTVFFLNFNFFCFCFKKKMYYLSGVRLFFQIGLLYLIHWKRNKWAHVKSEQKFNSRKKKNNLHCLIVEYSCVIMIIN